jgi:hypothetical protein
MLTMADRIGNYTRARQGQPRRGLTPTQRRRIRHKVGHQSARRTVYAGRTQ